MQRREFLKWQMCGALWLSAGAAGLSPSLAGAAQAPDVAVAKGDPTAATRAAVEMLGGMSTVVKPGQRVVIKPNMSFADPPEYATNTHPLVVRELARMCREAGAADIRILDNPLRSADICMERSGIRAACQDLPETSVRALQEPSFFVEEAIPKGEAMTSNRFMRDVLRADVLIAAPVAKSHSGAGVSLSMKGMMGLIYERGLMHRRGLHETIVDLNTRIPANLAVVDATRVLSTNGPQGPGRVLRENTVIASRDFVAADAYTVGKFEWWGRRMRPEQVKYIRLAHQRGLGRMDVENLAVREVSL